ncbi:hypothetical protein [Arthrobacter caoxuetaonis]|uniref:Uncharacterized protein n=1 Tax=Arthrobacter caoxuetaonis TaxID=2886935 RepID=A0A9X1MI85_9MICC|nr:hypothetical protein [Arthrobacter caoxuetaonis]MCC3299407.1 hypothetical protein [Arthrobacter caoxuetaonis]USQ59100.1 hypothetical protein NF551_18515 [Arthrobacter caoxuetaonis]
MNAWEPVYTATVWLVIAAIAAAGILSERWSVARALKLARSGRPLTPAQQALAYGDAGTGITAGKGRLAIELTERDLALGRRAARAFNAGTIVTIIVMAAIAVFVWLSVPLDTSVRYSGQARKPERMNIVPALLPAIGFCALLMRGARSPDAEHMGKRSRYGTYILGALLLGWALYIHAAIAIEGLVEGGFLTL